MDSRMYRGLANGYESTASAPSLRAAEPSYSYGMSSPTSEDSANVKVVVRVRKFLKRETDRNAKCLVEMDANGKQTTLKAPLEGDPAYPKTSKGKVYEDRSFNFDHSYWSHNEEDPHFASQEAVYKSFAEEFLDHNFDGYHTCIFAYGQTGSGKSYTMMGTAEQPGLIPRTCEELFFRIENEPSPNTNYHVHVSYFEVYNEHVRDLLVPRSSPDLFLKIRDSKSDGVFVQGLTETAIKSYADVERLLREGDTNRTTAQTKMNDTSSRSHAVFTIQLKQITHSLLSDETVERTARMRLVDLAGSERAKSTEATGARLKEGGQINKSLSTLGRVIAALAEAGQKMGRRTKERVPYRDSVLTWLLKDSLGGNSKTAMVACIAPSDYEETLSTLRYADQAKRIRTRATVNEDSLSAAERDAQIKQMAKEIELLQRSAMAASTRKREEADELEEYQRQVAQMNRLMEESRSVSEAKIKALQAEVEELRPLNATLQMEMDAIKRHLRLATEEIKNPIKIPSAAELEAIANGVPLDKSGPGFNIAEDAHSEEGYGSAEEQYDDTEEIGAKLAALLQEQAEEFLKEVGHFRRKINDDHQRFGISMVAEDEY
ncbi:kinesin [Pseudovirgaria hyperparasitica]|uniref:Kinesin-like protein n=1 Tax=Pseudovirgaria hyperparasitica TaxID=470096 RepID=A0A6A6WKL5_9PEZI|nr:kinesin [Pseudovirgaria hyperparasitica]KAF2762703.1 kinesin [Pseudovirgaria hyperparasitica]